MSRETTNSAQLTEICYARPETRGEQLRRLSDAMADACAEAMQRGRDEAQVSVLAEAADELAALAWFVDPEPVETVTTSWTGEVAAPHWEEIDASTLAIHNYIPLNPLVTGL